MNSPVANSTLNQHKHVRVHGNMVQGMSRHQVQQPSSAKIEICKGICESTCAFPYKYTGHTVLETALSDKEVFQNRSL